MRTVHYAVASLHYHKKIYLPYFIALVVMTVSIFFTLCLINSAQVVYHSLQDMLTNNPLNEDKNWDNALRFFFSQMKNIYLSFTLVSLVALTVLTFFFASYSFNRRQKELQTFFASGRSHFNVALQIIYEFVLPALLVVGVITCLTLVFQPFIQRICEIIHTQTAQMIRTNDLTNLNNGTQFGIRLPKNYPLLIQSVFISSRDWLNVLTTTIGQTVGLLLVNFAVGLPLAILGSKIRFFRKH